MCLNPSPDSTSESLALGIDFMDESHRALHDGLDHLSSVSDAEFVAVFEALLKEVHNHFKDEEQAMEDIGFPGILCHREQHAQALNALQQACLRVREGAIAEGRDIAGLFSQWFHFHITTMDRMLASFLQHAEASKADCVAA